MIARMGDHMSACLKIVHERLCEDQNNRLLTFC
jgi:hypothetical protein